jgi:hypothetical protein
MPPRDGVLPDYGEDFRVMNVHMSSTGQVLLVHFDGEGTIMQDSKDALGRELMQSRQEDKC